jgi:selenide,water dikinase
MEFLSRDVLVAADVAEELKLLLYDPQTSGGFLISAPEDKVVPLSEELSKRGIEATEIGRAVAPEQGWTIKVE